MNRGENGSEKQGNFNILMTKTNYDQLKNFKRIGKSSVNPRTAFDNKYMK